MQVDFLKSKPITGKVPIDNLKFIYTTSFGLQNVIKYGILGSYKTVPILHRTVYIETKQGHRYQTYILPDGKIIFVSVDETISAAYDYVTDLIVKGEKINVSF